MMQCNRRIYKQNHNIWSLVKTLPSSLGLLLARMTFWTRECWGMTSVRLTQVYLINQVVWASSFRFTLHTFCIKQGRTSAGCCTRRRWPRCCRGAAEASGASSHCCKHYNGLCQRLPPRHKTWEHIWCVVTATREIVVIKVSLKCHYESSCYTSAPVGWWEVGTGCRHTGLFH